MDTRDLEVFRRDLNKHAPPVWPTRPSLKIVNRRLVGSVDVSASSSIVVPSIQSTFNQSTNNQSTSIQSTTHQSTSNQTTNNLQSNHTNNKRPKLDWQALKKKPAGFTSASNLVRDEEGPSGSRQQENKLRGPSEAKQQENKLRPRRFKPPLNSNGGGGFNVSKAIQDAQQPPGEEEDVHPKLKGVDKALIERIENEILDLSTPVTFNDIAGLQQAKE